MVNRYRNGKFITCDYNLFKSTILIAAILIIGSSSTPAANAQQAQADPCDGALVNGVEARTIVRSLMQDLGWIESRSIRKTLGMSPVFHIRNIECVNGQWRVNTTLRVGLSNNTNAVVLVNSDSGAIETTVRSTLLAAE